MSGGVRRAEKRIEMRRKRVESRLPRGKSAVTMKKATSSLKKKRQTSSRPVDRDDIPPEYDFSRGRPNPYAERYAASENLVQLDADVAAVFPTARSGRC